MLFPNAPPRHGSTRAVPPLGSQELAADPALRTGRADALDTARRLPVRLIEPLTMNALRTEFERVRKRRGHLATLSQYQAKGGRASSRRDWIVWLGGAAGQRIGIPTRDESDKKNWIIRNWTVDAPLNPTAGFGAARQSTADHDAAR